MHSRILYGAAFIAVGIGCLWYDWWRRKRAKGTGSIVDAEGQDDPIPRNAETTFGVVLQCIGGLALGVGVYLTVTYFAHGG